MLLKESDKLLVVHRRLFERDEARFFIGVVDAYESGIVKVTGHSYVRDMMSGRLIEKAEARTKILAISSGTLIVYQLPEGTVLETIQFASQDGRLLMTDGKGFKMNLSELAHLGKV